MKRFNSVWTALVAGIAIGNGFSVTGFILRQHPQSPCPFRLQEATGPSSRSYHNVSTPQVFGDEGRRKRKRSASNTQGLRTPQRTNQQARDIGVTEESGDCSIEAFAYVRSLRTHQDVDEWMLDTIRDVPQMFDRWRTRSHIDFVKLLLEKKAYNAIMTFLRHATKSDVKVYTTAMFGFALSIGYRHLAMEVLNLMDQRCVQPTSLTFIALFGSVDGGKATSNLMKRIESYKRVELTEEVFNSAIFACKRRSSDGETSMSWQTAMNLLQVMRRRRIHPTVKTYHALLQVLGGTGQVHMAKSLVQQLHSTAGMHADDRVWAAAINVCADIGDYHGALHFVEEMNAKDHHPNLLVCSILLKAFAVSAQDQLALQALDMMVGTLAKDEPPRRSIPYQFHLPQVPPDRIALNTVISACAKSGSLVGAIEVLDRMKAGEFLDPTSGQEIAPDLISYHNILKFSTDPEFAMNLVKEMRLSRRNRKGVVVPTSVTFAHAINACQQAESPNSQCAARLLKWALDDEIQPTVYMFAPAIWAAQKSGDRAAALRFFVQMTELGCSPNSVAYNGVISALCDNGDVDHAILIYEEMKDKGMCINGPVVKVSITVS